MHETIADAAQWLSLICISLSFFGCVYAFAAALAARRFARRPRSEAPAAAEGVAILKPLHGAEPQLYENLRTFCDQDTPAPLQVIFGAQDARDPALDVARRLVREFPERELHIVVSAAQHGANRKVSNLINMAKAARQPILVLADSDMRVTPDYLSRITGALAEPDVGLVTCLYHGRAVGGLWSELAAMAIDAHFLPSVLVGVRLGLARPCFGSTIALRRETLARIGGFEAVANHLADDHALGAAVRGLGLKVAIPSQTIAHCCAEISFAALWRHELRWARTIRVIDPIGFLGSGISHAFGFALLGAALRGFDGLGLGALALAFASRIFLQWRMIQEFELPNRKISLTPLRDVMSFVIYLSCFWSWEVDWRGHNFVVASDGRMREAADGADAPAAPEQGKT